MSRPYNIKNNKTHCFGLNFLPKIDFTQLQEIKASPFKKKLINFKDNYFFPRKPKTQYQLEVQNSLQISNFKKPFFSIIKKPLSQKHYFSKLPSLPKREFIPEEDLNISSISTNDKKSAKIESRINQWLDQQGIELYDFTQYNQIFFQRKHQFALKKLEDCDSPLLSKRKEKFLDVAESIPRSNTINAHSHFN